MKKYTIKIIVAIAIPVIITACTIYYSQIQFSRNLKIEHYTKFIESIEKAFNVNEEMLLMEDGYEKDVKRYEMESFLQNAYAVALATMDDSMFEDIDKMLDGNITIQKKNLIYYKMRKKLYPDTIVLYENIMDRNHKGKR